ncbi:hypothetical protein ESCO_005809 [Escovopsis weberi]|uniref:Extracellular serine-rich protein n=1 Tax=Escovopsis weberi TaxID=150374 RepID=A0A0M9VUH3_ESCWE|nr:hypothetical protein ESCO_005809 [Escovopsis weberi]
MVSFNFAALAMAFAASAIAVPTGTTFQQPSTTVSVPQTGVTHSITAGLGGQLIYDPENVVADPGDILEIKFLPANHSIAQSSFGEPCKPLNNGVSVFPGFPFATKEGLSPEVFQFVVPDRNPLWFYCPQANHCEKGMALAVNQNFNSANTLAAYKAKAALVDKTVVPDVSSAGSVIPDPHPDRGFN